MHIRTHGGGGGGGGGVGNTYGVKTCIWAGGMHRLVPVLTPDLYEGDPEIPSPPKVLTPPPPPPEKSK